MNSQLANAAKSLIASFIQQPSSTRCGRGLEDFDTIRMKSIHEHTRKLYSNVEGVRVADDIKNAKRLCVARHEAPSEHGHHDQCWQQRLRWIAHNRQRHWEPCTCRRPRHSCVHSSCLTRLANSETLEWPCVGCSLHRGAPFMFQLSIGINNNTICTRHSLCEISKY